MNAKLASRSVRWISLVAAVAVAAALVYRGNTYIDLQSPGVLAPTMCVLAAISLVCTTLALVFNSNAVDDYEVEAAV